MTQHETGPSRTPWGLSGPLLVGGLAGVVLVAALLSLVSWALRPAAVLVAPVPTGHRLSAAAAAQVPRNFSPPTSVVSPGHQPPIEVAIPVISVRSRLVGLRLDPDGTLQVPTDYGGAGWYSDGPAPGDSGPPAVIVGHVDSHAGPGIFYRLSELRTGDAVLVRRTDGSDVHFTVYRSADYPKDAFPATQVYAPRPTPELRLITCTGTFDRATGHYRSNHVVYARLAAAPHATPSRGAAAHG